MDTKGNWSFITIRFHETDVVTFDHFHKFILIPYIESNETYLIGIEHPTTSERHLHAVIKNTTSRDNDKVKQKIKNLVKSKKNNIWNTITDNAVDVKPLKSNLDIYSTIGYVAKQSTTDIQSNIPEEEIDAGRSAYYHESKTPICQVENILEYKSLSKGNLLLYLYDAHIKHKDIPLKTLPSYMVKYMNVSFISCKSLLKYAMLELKLKIGYDEKSIDLENEFDKNDAEELIQNNYDLINSDNIKQLLTKIEILEFQNKNLQDENTSLKNKLESKKN